jgi:hypothetical protein
MTSLPTIERNRLAKLLALLGSDKAGERDAAGLAAHRMLQQHGLKREPLHSTWRRVCAELAIRPDGLRPWERSFVADLPKFPRLSSKQRYVLQEIAARVLGRPVA